VAEQAASPRKPLAVGLPAEADFEDSGLDDLGSCLVTGGAGFLGRHLAFELIRRGERVRVFDCQPIGYSHERLEFVQGDVRDLEQVRKACEGIDTVFHTAAVLEFLEYATAVQRELSHAVNATGVANVVQACREARVRRLVHTSSNNVTFDGPVIDGDETRPYAESVRDLYTRTKIEGEKIALAANGRDGLLTCAIRPGGIFGPGEKLLLPRVVEECAAGRYLATIGDGSALSDNTYIDNLVDAQIAAARHLVPGSPVCGQAYFVSDGVPINYFDFFRPIVEGLGFTHPRRRVPAGLLYAVATAWEWLHWAIRVPRPPLSRLEVRKIAVAHYNRIDKARRDFGWTPRVGMDEAMARCLVHCRELLAAREAVDRPHWGWWLAIPSGMAALGALAVSADAHALWSREVTGLTPRWLLAGVFLLALAEHVRKGLLAVRIAERAGLHRTSLAWGWQTFALGFASLRRLDARVRRRESGETR
jgi:3beta-hydroxy-delta5-steroid dehydrogenase/steroid delta-isomerase